MSFMLTHRYTAPLLLLLLTLLSLPVSAGAATLIVARGAEAAVSLVSLPEAKVASTLPVGTGPHEVAVSPSGRLALIANYGGPGPAGARSTPPLTDGPPAP